MSNVSISVKGITKGLLTLDRQLLFAANRFTNRVTELTQNEIRRNVRSKFTVRSSWVERRLGANSPGINAIYARNTGQTEINTSVVTGAWWLQDQEEGNTRRPNTATRPGGGHLATPTDLIRPSRDPRILRLAKRPKGLLGRAQSRKEALAAGRRPRQANPSRDPFILKTNSSRFDQIIVQRPRRGADLISLYLFRRAQKIKRRATFEPAISKIFGNTSQLTAILDGAILNAYISAK